MFLHVLKYKLKEMFRMKWALGWTILFPIALATAFYFGFGNLIKESSDTFKPVPVAYVTEDAQEQIDPFAIVLKQLSDKDAEEQLFRLKICKETEAKKLLKDEKIDGIFYGGNGKEPALVIEKNGMNQTFLSQFLREYQNKALMYETTGELSASEISLQTLRFKNDPISPLMNFFFALLAMASLFSSWLSVTAMNGISAAQSDRGKRYECAPVPKTISVLAAATAGIIVQIFSNILLVLYIEGVLQLSFHASFLSVVFVTSLGGIIGITSGMAFSVLAAKSETLKIVLPLAFTMTCSFLSGLMVDSMKQFVETKMPLLNKINPAAVMTDALYTLGTYGTGNRYYQDIIIMIVMIIVFVAVGIAGLSRRSYDNI